MDINKRITNCFGIFFVLLLMAAGNAAAGSEQNSAIYEDRIVWQDDSNGNWDIQMYNISTSTKIQITNDEADQQIPDIYGNRIVWQDFRNGNQDVYMYDISTSREVRITTSGSYQGKPAIYGDKIVWEDDRNGNRDIYMYDLSTSTETRITNNASDQSSPDIYEDRIVWTEEGAIYLYNISTSTETQITPHWWGWEGGSEDGNLNRAPFIYGDRIVCEAESATGNYYVYVYDLSNSTSQTIGLTDEAYLPAIYGDKIVWENIPGGTPFSGEENHDIHMYNISTSMETRITTNNSRQGDPAIYGDRIVWTDERNAVSYDDLSDVYMYDLLTSTETRITTAKEEQPAQGKETRITTNEKEQEHPAIYGNRIVWTDWRNGNQHDYLNGDIYMYDISTSTETRITTNESSQSLPAIYGDRIVWVDYRNDNGSYTNSDIYMYDLSTHKETQITTSGSANSPAIYGKRIVWQDWRNDNGSYVNSDIYMYDLSTHKETQITTDGSAQQTPAIYGDRIVWCDSRKGDNYNSNWDIYMYDLSTSKEMQITTGGSAYSPVAIYRDRIVWTDTRRSEWKNIYMYNLSTGTETRVAVSKSALDPAIYKDRIVWEDNQKFNGNSDIFMYNISTFTETKITANESVSWCNPDIYGNRIVWEDVRNGNRDIYMFTPNSAEVPDNDDNDTDEDSDKPVADFSANVTSGYAPLSVLFTDLSKNATGRVWDFNSDGVADSTEKTPAYVFSVPGTYTVTLTVSNENDVSSKFAVITVLEAEIKDNGLPVANFTSNVTSGKAPLSVLFTDLSQNATGRIWDFNNDGISDSADKSPVYVFASEGTYIVNFTAVNENGTASKQATITVSSEQEHHGGGGSSGGGGGGSPEPAKNVEVKELSQEFVKNGKEVKFNFTKNATCVVYVSFDSKKTAGKITTIVEQLKGKSSLVSGLPSDQVYKFFNIWVGNSGFATSKNIENPVICFKVEKSWIKEKNIDMNSITLNRYSDEKWETLSSNLSGEDDNYLYFTSETPGFSCFAITGKEKSTGEENDTGIKIESESRTVNENDTGNEGPETENGQSKGMPGFGMVYGIVCMFVLFLCKRK